MSLGHEIVIYETGCKFNFECNRLAAQIWLGDEKWIYAWSREIRDGKNCVVYKFETSDHALMFKLKWGGDV